MKIFHAYFSSASVLLFLRSSFFFEGTKDIVVYVFSPVWSVINNRRSQETYHLVFFFSRQESKNYAKYHHALRTKDICGEWQWSSGCVELRKLRRKLEMQEVHQILISLPWSQETKTSFWRGLTVWIWQSEEDVSQRLLRTPFLCPHWWSALMK